MLFSLLYIGSVIYFLKQLDNSMYDKEMHALIKFNGYPCGYKIVDKKLHGFLIIEDVNEAQIIVDNLLAAGVEVYETESEFNSIYPPLNSEQRLSIAMEFWKNIPEEKWPKDVKQYYDANKLSNNQ